MSTDDLPQLPVLRPKWSMWDVNFVVVDVETTGHSPTDNRITEIACVVVRGGEVVQEFSSLVNPHQFIPPFIAHMTGITNAMVFSAPEPRDVFVRVAEILSIPNAVFVAHNAAFDFGFVNQTMVRSGLDPLALPQFCTLKLARRLLPPSVKKNVGDVAAHFEIDIENRHRAMGDAMATAQFFVEMLEMVQREHEIESLDDLLRFQNKRLRHFNPTPAFMKRVEPFLATMPEEPGVYTMLDSEGKTLYVGKAKSLRDRVRSYFQQGAQHPPKIERMVGLVHEIRWECTDTELGALLLESREIKLQQPPYNTASKRIRRHPFVRLTVQDEFPRLEWTSAVGHDAAEYYGPFRSRGTVQEITDTVQKHFGLRLCSEPITPNPAAQPCFYYHIKRCGAPCAALQSREEYAAIVEEVRKFLSGYTAGIIERLRTEMTEAADRLEFEKAGSLRNRMQELQRVFERKEVVSTAANNHNVIVVIPASRRDKTIEVFFVVGGQLFHQQTVGRKAPLDALVALITKGYFSAAGEHRLLTPTETDEMHIITSWIYRNRDAGKFIYTEMKSIDLVIAEFTDAIRTCFAEEDAMLAESA